MFCILFSYKLDLASIMLFSFGTESLSDSSSPLGSPVGTQGLRSATRTSTAALPISSTASGARRCPGDRPSRKSNVQKRKVSRLFQSTSMHPKPVPQKEPLSAALSALTLVVQFNGWLSFFLLLYYKLPLRPETHKTYYEYTGLWHIYGLLAMNSWFWSAIYHSCDTIWTEKAIFFIRCCLSRVFPHFDDS
ncbi:hypothetical protein ZEAMMB73_Zm00001d036530 [Zea mays]|uniref:Post-GPI attachment to proteins factor 3 n=1 Tax=Zea mays TaxID=4577 RepID=A0A1D6LP30_MAIZE